jgi:hypothetical protein
MLSGTLRALSALAPASIGLLSGGGDVLLCGFEDGQHGYGPAEEEQSAA